MGSVLFLIFALPLFAHAQQKDSMHSLSEQLDSAMMAETPAEDPEEQSADDDDDEDEEQSVFLPNQMDEKDSIQIRRINPATKKAQQEDDAFWYANHLFKKNKKDELKPGRTSIFLQPWFQTLVWIVVIVGFITFLIIFLSNSNVGLFRRNKYIGAVQEGDTDLDDIFAINYQQELDKAIATGDYRLAVRLLYLRLLRNLANRNTIDYKQDRTNFDYLLQLQQTRYYADFFRLTRHYEYSWYGQFSVAEDKFSLIRKEFENFDRKLN